ncbi:MAG: 4-alpha-glucanotransferase, partial [Luteolibacter sp.]
MSLRSEGSVTKQLVPMKWRDAGHWEVEISVDASQGTRLEYEYIYRNGETEVKEWGGARVVDFSNNHYEKILFSDDWRSAGSVDRVYEGKVFAAVEKGKPGVAKVSGKPDGNHELSLFMTRLPAGMVPCVMGGLDALGEWAYEKAMPLADCGENLWKLRLDLPMDYEVSYKYGLYDPSLKKAVKLEDGENRRLRARDGMDFVQVADENFRRSADMKFRAAGVAIPVFSLRSEIGGGVGEFADLKGMADWAKSAGLKMLQILPINDTTSSRTWTDSYPYSAISVNALHPIYMRLDAMTYPLQDEVVFAAEKARLNSLKQLDYEEVMEVKWRLTREVFDKNHDVIIKDTAFMDFLKSNWNWVLDYGVFCVKRDEFGTAEFAKWGEWAVYDSKTAEALAISTDVLYHVWLQYELDLQLADAVSYMHSAGVALKGDLPIGIDRDSVDAWVAPHLFRMDRQTGAPPDLFAKKGQNWGFPTYNWEEMAKDGYAWWRARFEKLSRYFDAYRIDHILGFFRIWQVPAQHIDGIMGWFEPALPVKLEEFAERGVEFDYDRFCKPFIRDSGLKETFGKFADGVRRDFLVDLGLGCFSLKEEFSSQRSIREFFAKLGEGDWANQEWIRDALENLVTEVLFFEVGGSGETLFHPRMSMVDTLSFQDLNPDTQGKLQAIYTDYFYLRQEGFWKANAYAKLPAMRVASDMLLCGEDLGMVPACVPGVMADMGMLSLEIQRWPKSGDSEFFNPTHSPYMSVVSTGTHDMETLRSWWRADETRRAKFAWELFGVGFP